MFAQNPPVPEMRALADARYGGRFSSDVRVMRLGIHLVAEGVKRGEISAESHPDD